jgi:hypothetical protein
MYIIRRKGKGLMLYRPKRATTHKTIVAQELKTTDVSVPTIDIEQSGSGVKGVKNKLSQIALHETSNGKKKFNKFISLSL